LKTPSTFLLFVVASLFSFSPAMGGKYYVLCEGNFGQANASLWSIDEDLGSVDGPLIWNTSTNPLGDVAQSMTLYQPYDGSQDRLYLVMNGSHQLRVVDLAGDQEQHVDDIHLPGASPRYLAIDHATNLGYISSWGLGAILVMDMQTHAIVDTFDVGGLPEEMLIIDDHMYVSIPMEIDWSAAAQVLKISIWGETMEIVQRFDVITGPGALTQYNDHVYVTSLYYNDAWETFSGTSRIDEMNLTVTSMDHGIFPNFTADICQFGEEGRVYRTFGNSLVPLNDDLSLDEDHAFGQLTGIYTFYSHYLSQTQENILIGTTDFVAPDQIHLYNSYTGSDLGSFQVGALPSQIIYHWTPASGLSEENTAPTHFALGYNHPNPFNPETTIPFTLKADSQVSLDILDLRGRQVRSLGNSSLPAGLHHTSWDGQDNQGRPVASGLYHLLMQVGAETQIRKLTLLR